jgi:hypothetical protein
VSHILYREQLRIREQHIRQRLPQSGVVPEIGCRIIVLSQSTCGYSSCRNVTFRLANRVLRVLPKSSCLNIIETCPCGILASS